MNSINSASRRKVTAFTLIEILIVVVILGILAGIVMTNADVAGHESRIGSMVTQLRDLRSQVTVYRIEHRDALPPLITTQWNSMMTKTNATGGVPAAGDRTFGPYFDRAPVNPLTASSTIVAVGTAPALTTGWYYDSATGELHGANKQGAMSDTGY